MTESTIEAKNREVSEIEKVRMQLIKSGHKGWQDLPHWSIIGHVRIDVSEQLTEEDCKEWEESTTFEALTDNFKVGHFLCHIKEVARFKPVKVRNGVIEEFTSLNLKCDAVKSRVEI